MAFDGGYHGSVFVFKDAVNQVNVPFDWVFAPYNDAAAAAKLIAQHANDLAAVIVEPMQGSGGCIPAEPDFLSTLRRETEKVGALLVFDEVMTSRLAPGGLQTRYGIRPDLMTLGKYVGGRHVVRRLRRPRRADAAVRSAQGRRAGPRRDLQ